MSFERKGTMQKIAYNNIKEKYPECIIKLRIEYQPNAVNLFNLIKEELRNKRKTIKVVYNYIKLCLNYTDEAFIADVKKINTSKKEV